MAKKEIIQPGVPAPEIGLQLPPEMLPELPAATANLVHATLLDAGAKYIQPPSWMGQASAEYRFGTVTLHQPDVPDFPVVCLTAVRQTLSEPTRQSAYARLIPLGRRVYGDPFRFEPFEDIPVEGVPNITALAWTANSMANMIESLKAQADQAHNVPERRQPNFPRLARRIIASLLRTDPPPIIGS